MSTTEKTWSSDAGPRQTKQVMEAIGDLKYHGRQIKILSDHGPRCVVPMPGQVSSACLQAIETIGNSVGWKITKDNYKNLIAACAHAVKIVPIPEKDERTSPEEREARDKANAERQAAQEEKSRADKQAIASLVAELKKKFPWAKGEDSGLSTQARAAANLKEQLNRTFPGIQFSVKSSSFSMGDSVSCKWSMGPTDEQVNEIAKQYQYGSFDGMQDMYVSDSSVERKAHAMVLGESKYVSTDRDIPMKWYNLVRDSIMAENNLPAVEGDKFHNVQLDGNYLDSYIRAAFAKVSFPPGAEVTGIEHANGGTALERYRVTFKAGYISPPIVEIPDMSAKAQYCRLQDAYPDDLVLLRVEGDYVAFGTNAEILGSVLGLQLTPMGGTLNMTAFPFERLDEYRAKLDADYTVTTGEYVVPPAAKEGGISCHVEKHHHTKHGFDFWLVVSDTRVDEDTYKSIRKRCESLGGWYSRKFGKCPGGYAFKDETVANGFAASL